MAHRRPCGGIPCIYVPHAHHAQCVMQVMLNHVRDAFRPEIPPDDQLPVSRKVRTAQLCAGPMANLVCSWLLSAVDCQLLESLILTTCCLRC